MVVYPILYQVLYLPRGAGFLPLTVVSLNFSKKTTKKMKLPHNLPSVRGDFPLLGEKQGVLLQFCLP